MSFFTYVAKSSIKEYYYKGHCHDLEKRIKEHNIGMTKSLLPYIPVELIYHEEFLTLEEAIKREKYFKSAAGRRYLKKKLAF
jgi:putative endonuclease